MDDIDRRALEAMIDEALEESFPASDPPAFSTMEKRRKRHAGKPERRSEERQPGSEEAEEPHDQV